MKRTILIVLILAAAVAVIALLRRPELPPPPAPPSVRQEYPAPPRAGGDVVIRTVRPGETEKRGVKEQEEPPFQFNDSQPLEPQVREILGAVDIWDKDIYEACRKHSDAVVAALLNILKDPSAGYNRREKGLGLLEYLGASSAVPVVLALAQGDADPMFRADCIRTLGSFPAAITVSSIRALYDAARTEDEKYRSIEVLGTLGDPATQPFLDHLAKNDPDSLMRQLADRAATQVRILHSTQKVAELVKILSEADHPLQEWAVNRIVAEKKPDLAHHLREALEAHRKLPRDKVSPYFEVYLLRGLRDLGQELRPNERKFLENFSIDNEEPLQD